MEIKQFTISLADGRELEVVEVGDKNNPVIVLHNGTPNAPVLVSAQIEAALAKGLRLVTYGRPGYGKSSRHHGRDVASAAIDTAELADILGIGKFATIGISGGGPHALACAALLGNRVIGVACVSGIAPYDGNELDFLKGMGQDDIDLYGAALEGEAVLRTYLETQVPPPGTINPEDFVKQLKSILCPADVACLDGVFGIEVAKSIIEGMQHGFEGWLDDNLAFTKSWGFDLSDIIAPVQVWQGTNDQMVPHTHGKWLFENIPDAETHLLNNEGHLSTFYKHITDVYDFLKAEF